MTINSINFNKQANTSTLRTGNSWSMSSNLTASFNSYPPLTQITNAVSFRDVIRSPSANIIYMANSDGIYQYSYSDNNQIGSITTQATRLTPSLPTNSYESIDLSSDGTKLFVMDVNGLVCTTNLTTSWNVATAQSAVKGNTWMKGQSSSFNRDYFMKEDGTILYVFSDNNRVDQYSLFNGDLGTSQLTHTKSIGSVSGYFKDDGTKLFTIYNSGSLSYIAEYALSESWNINSASFTTEYYPFDGGTGRSTTRASCIRLSTDGSNVFFYASESGTQTRYLYRVELNTPWSISSRKTNWYTQRYADTSNYFEFKDDGTQLFIAGQNPVINSYSLFSPWNLSIVTPDNGAAFTSIRGVANTGFSIFNSGSNVVLAASNSNTTHTMQMSPWSLSTYRFANTDVSLLTLANTVNSNTYFRVSSDNSNIIVGAGRVFHRYAMSTNLDIRTATYQASANLSASLPSNSAHFTISSDGLTMYQASTLRVSKLLMNSSFNVSSLTYSGDFKSLSGNVTNALISNPPTKFTVGYSSDRRLYDYEQPTSNLLSTSNLVLGAATGRYTLNIPTDLTYGLKFTNDGRNFIVSSNNRLYFHRLSTPWNISSVNSVIDLSISTSTFTFGGFSISRNGKYLYLLHSTLAQIYTAELRRPWDYLNGLAGGSIGSGTFFPTPLCDLELSRDGLRSFISGSISFPDVEVFDNPIQWTPSSGTSGSTILTGFTGSPLPFVLSRNGRYIYTTYNTNNAVNIRRRRMDSQWGTSSTANQDILIPQSKNWLVHGISIDPSGNILYLLDAASKTVFSYSVGAQYGI